MDRLWPRGMRKEDLQHDAWLKDLGPSRELREWFNHEPQHWNEFRRRFFNELEAKTYQLEKFRQVVGTRSVLLLYGSRDEIHNNAIALKEFLEKHEVDPRS